MSGYSDKTLKTLKEDLRQKGLKLSGRKSELIDRLQQAQHIHAQCEMEPEYSMDAPDATLYKDIHDDMTVPLFSLEDAETYYRLNDKVFDHKKYSELYTERFLRYIRICLRGPNVHIKANVWAEMKRKTSYPVDVCLRAGAVSVAQCECPVGQGPFGHCKHIGVVLYCLHELSTGQLLIIDLACTETVQTFHRPKRIRRGSPVRADKIHDSGVAESLRFDPHPNDDQPDSVYRSNFRSVLLNYQGAGRRMGVLQSTGSANMHGITDHSYDGPTELNFLKKCKLVSITEQERAEIELSTRGQAKSKVWKEERSMRLTASRYKNICSVKSENANKLAKTLLSPISFSSTATNHGLKYEHAARETYQKKYRKTVSECGLFVHPQKPYLAATPDGIVDATTCIEIKCPWTAKEKQINPTTVPFLKDVNGTITLDKKHDYYYQVQGQLSCSDRQICQFCIYTFNDFVVVPVARDEAFIEDMVTKLDKFYIDVFREELVRKFVYRE